MSTLQNQLWVCKLQKGLEVYFSTSKYKIHILIMYSDLKSCILDTSIEPLILNKGNMNIITNLPLPKENFLS